MRTRPEPARARRGVTLLELLLGLSLAGILLLGVSALQGQASEAGFAISRHAAASDSAANGERLLRAMVSRAEGSADSARTFAGEAHRASFDGWCDRPAGWMERCRVTLSLLPFEDRTDVVASMSTGETLRLRRLRGRAVLRYYGQGADSIGWMTAWGQSMLPPIAVGLVAGADTVVLPTGARP